LQLARLNSVSGLTGIESGEGNMAKQLKKGDKVSWESSQGTVEGKVQKKVTSPTEIKGHHVAASEENPEFLVKSDKTGAVAAHKPGALKKR
jgi:Hypervirulence associated proteins TUDOR domain